MFANSLPKNRAFKNQKMKLEDIIRDSSLLSINQSLLKAAHSIYKELKSGNSLVNLKTSNASHDTQIALDVFADHQFKKELKVNKGIKYILSEESPEFLKYGSGELSIAIDPLDGSKSAMVGIPSGSIFGVFKDVNEISDFSGKHILSSGFFVYGINLEVFLCYHQNVYKGVFDPEKSHWNFENLMDWPDNKMIAINASNQYQWDEWLQDFYNELINGEKYNMRWYASMVTEVKRLIMQGGVFAYPADKRKSYEHGHLRLIYEAIPMAYLIHHLGGSSSNGQKSLLDVDVLALHQKTPVFLGNKQLIAQIEQLDKRTN